MKALVAVKQVIEYSVKIQLTPDNSGVAHEHVKKSMNPLDEVALEEAIRWKGEIFEEVVAVSIGPLSAQETLLAALARGADRAIHIVSEAVLEPIDRARILKVIIERESIDCAWLGSLAIDDEYHQTGQILAGMMMWPQATAVSKIAWDNEKQWFTVTSDMARGTHSWQFPLPAVITVALHLNEPRPISLPNILKAKAKPLIQENFNDLGLSFPKRVEYCRYEKPLLKQACIMLHSVEELIEKLKTFHQDIQ